MGNKVEKMRQREIERRETKREELLAFLEGSRRRQSLLEIVGNAGGDEAQNLNGGDNDRQMGFGRSQGPGGGGGGPDDGSDHRLTDREREAWLYRMENEAVDVINDNMELQEERRRERERREERREELEHMGVDGVGGMGDMDPGGGEDPNAQREEGPIDELTPVSSRRSSLVASDDSDIDDLVSLDDNDVGDDDDIVEDDNADEAEVVDDAVSEGAPDSERGETEAAAAEEAGGGGDDEERRREH